MMQYSIIVPVHNEVSHIERQIATFIERLPPEIVELLVEVIIVENGSTDGTLEACHRLEQRFPILVRICTIPRGSYGEAIKRGMLESRGTHLSILECDFLDSAFVRTSIAMFRAGKAEFIVGSKRHPQSVDRRPIKRRVLTALYNRVFLHVCLGYHGTDTHGLKSIETRVAKKLCEIAITSDEVFQTEIVLLAWRLGITIEEVAVEILEIRNPTVTVFRRLPKVLSTVRALQRSLVRFPKTSPQLRNLS